MGDGRATVTAKELAAQPSDATLRAALRYAPLRRALIGRAAGTAGSWMQTVAAGWLVYDLTRSAAAVAVLTLLARGPALVLSGFGGVLADRYDCRKLAGISSVLMAVPAAALAAVAWEGISTVVEVYAATLLIGLLNAVSTAPTQVVVVRTVPREHEKQATALTSVAFNVARLVGPAVGGVLVVAIGPGPCFAINALSFVIVAAVFLSLPVPATGPKKAERGGQMAALSALRRHGVVVRLIVAIGLFALLAGPIQELAPAIAKRHGYGAQLLGFLLAAMAAGGMVGAWLRAWLERHGMRRSTAIPVAMIVAAVPIGVLAFSPYFSLAMVAMFFGGVLWEIIWVESLAGVQLLSPPELTGRAVGLFFAITAAAVVAGALAVGALFDLLGVEWGLAVPALALAIGGLWQLSWRGGLRHAERRAPNGST